MAIERRYNALSQLRVETSDVLSIESAASADFDSTAYTFLSGTTNTYVLRGFNILMGSAIGGAASSLNMQVDPGALLHSQASQSGTYYLVPVGTAPQILNSATNPIVIGAFSPSSVNYVGIDYVRAAAASTDAQSYFWDVAAQTELIETVPKAILLSFTINISNVIPPANILPIAIVITDSGNNVLSVEDCRPLFFRQGQGGWTPNPFYAYPWPQGQLEDPFISTSNSIDPFFGADKAIGTLKDKLDAITTQIQSVVGGTYWYSQNIFGSLAGLREDLGNTVITGSGFIEHSATAAGQINWNQNIYIDVVGSALSYELVANPSSTDITLANDQCAYITLVRGQLFSPNLIFTNGSPVVTSVGAVAFTSNMQAGDYIKLASDGDSNYYEILTVNSLTQVTLVENFTGTSTGVSGSQSTYAFGSYTASPTPSTPRNIYITSRELVPAGEDVFWLYLREDNGGSIPRVYIRFLSTELSQGESEDISDPLSLELLQYVGSPLESAFAPQYGQALNPAAVPQITNVQVGAEITIPQSAYFVLYSSGNHRSYYAWFNENGGGTDPAPVGVSIPIPVAITTGQTAAQVATALMTQLNLTARGDFIATIESGHTDTVVIKNASAGATYLPINGSTSFTITNVQTGVGNGNVVIQDGQNLTLAIAELDQEFSQVSSLLDNANYDETIIVVASGGTPPGTVNGPVAANTILSLPYNSRESDAVQYYTVGKAVLQFYLNGQRWDLGDDWLEVGSVDSPSTQFQILVPLEVKDQLECSIVIPGNPGGGGPVGPQGPPGIAGPTGMNAAGGPVAYSIKNANYSILTSDCSLAADCTGGPITFTLPPAAGNGGRIFYCAKIDASGNSLTIVGSGIDLIDGMSSLVTSTQWESFSLVSYGSFWLVF